jgi:hypothetical protein
LEPLERLELLERLDIWNVWTGTCGSVHITDKPLLLNYLDAVFARTKAYLSTVTNDDLDRVLNEPPYQPLPTLSIRLKAWHRAAINPIE